MKFTKKIKATKLAGRETSRRKVAGQKFCESKPCGVSEKTDYIRSHVTHFVLCLRDAFGFRDPLEVVNKVTIRLFKLFPDVPIEKLFKWFYGNALAWSTNNQGDTLGFEPVDKLGIRSKDWYASCNVFGGRLSSFLRKFFRRQVIHTKPNALWKRKKIAFSNAQTFLMFKKGSPQVSKELITEADRKHREAMSNVLKGKDRKKKYWDSMIDHTIELEKIPPILDWGEEEENFGDELELQKSIKKVAKAIIHRIFKPGSFKREMKKEKTSFPSTSAHYEPGTSQLKGGAVNLIKDYFLQPVIGDLDRMTYHPRTGVITHYKVFYPEVSGRIASNLLEEESIASPVYLQEPLKVRTITKGPALNYWFMKPIQGFLWRRLALHPVFQLIGKPISKEVLNEVLLKHRLRPEAKWLSGDYSAATDNLVRWFSKYIWSEICIRTGIPDQVYKLGKDALVNHTLDYQGSFIKQENGQLMGSPLSFPILCIANATICYMSFDEDIRLMDEDPNLFSKKQLLDVPMLINGDDCVMHYTDGERYKWRRYANFIGMTPSPGKCYFADNWLQMNSELFYLRSSSFRQIPFINFSLASPYLAKGGDERTVESLSQSMLSFCFGKSNKFVDIWMRRMGPYLKKMVPGMVSWYLPQCLGGLGLISGKLSGDLFTTSQLKVATLFYNRGLNGDVHPYKLSSMNGGKATYQRKNVDKYIIRRPVIDTEMKSVKTFWAERFFKEKTEEESFTPLLWEHLIKEGRLIVEKTKATPILSNKVLKVFKKDSKNVEPLPLKELLRYRGQEEIIPQQILESNYEPKGVFLDILAALTNKQKEVLTF